MTETQLTDFAITAPSELDASGSKVATSKFADLSLFWRTFFLLALLLLVTAGMATAVTDDFTGLAANYADISLRPLWEAWLYSTRVPPL